MRLTASIIALTIGLASCTGSSKVATTNSNSAKAERKKMACADVHVEMSSTHLDWFTENSSILSKSDQVLVLPKAYKVYSIDSAQLSTFFKAVQKGETVNTVVPLPAPADCQLFTIVNNVKKDTNTPGGMISAAGEGKGQKMTLSYYNGYLTGNINWFDIAYEIQTTTVNKQPYFIVYAKQPPPENKNKNNNPAASQPQIIDITYDK